jgi:predicted transcriptional regulator
METINLNIMAMLKSEYSRRSGIPFSTLRYYMNKLYFEELAAMDYKRNQNYLTPKQIDYLDRKLVVME